jgi:tetratricopeptide (TPR) repeat protein
VIAAIKCGRTQDVVEAARKRAASGGAEDYTSTTLRRALQHADLLAYIAGAPIDNLESLLADPAPSPAPVGPPTMLRLEELVGEARLKAGRAPGAVAAYERALQLTPNRSVALLGLARARRAAGDIPGATETYRKLLENWRNADPDMPALREAREGAAVSGGARH